MPCLYNTCNKIKLFDEFYLACFNMNLIIVILLFKNDAKTLTESPGEFRIIAEMNCSPPKLIPQYILLVLNSTILCCCFCNGVNNYPLETSILCISCQLSF